MDYYSDTQYAQSDPYAAPPAKKQREGSDDGAPLDEVVILKEKVTIPVEKYPGYNFVGSLLGPQGSILKELSKSTRARLAIMGKGSMKDKEKEAELTNSEEAEHAHLKEPLHVLIDIKAPRAEAHRRMSIALIEIYKFMVPPGRNQQQYNEGPYDSYGGGGYGEGGYGGPPRGRGGPRGGRGRGGGRGAPRGGYGGY